MVEGQPIEAIPVTTTDDSGEKPTVKVEGLPPGLTSIPDTDITQPTPQVPDVPAAPPNINIEEQS
ncbi:hypothetical protein [Staphylococcus felis]|uniref:hypothetical protein n=1 Tax=Staphylococcus felis TaxID=46127 RepID=UPI000E225F03|nr:hypothetical protein [Staphylococcus felis]REI31362.1 hypothetical protein DOS80_06170 [Staphylococcus felis]